MKFINGVTNYDEWRDHAKDYETYKQRMAVISEMLAKKERGEKLTFADEVRLVGQVVVSALTGKLEDFYSVSTSVLMNPCCQARARMDGCICKECYAANNVSRFGTLAQALETNYLILNNFIISPEAWETLAIPSINGKARTESHGDTASVVCAINHTRIVASHSWLVFGTWTKNLTHYKPVFEAEGKPDNMIFIASSPMTNIQMEIPEPMRPYVDHRFTVCEEEFAKAHGIQINCGTWKQDKLDHKCKNCMRCYDRFNTEFDIWELKK